VIEPLINYVSKTTFMPPVFLVYKAKSKEIEWFIMRIEVQKMKVYPEGLNRLF